MTARFVIVTWITHILISLFRESGSVETIPLPLGCRGTDPVMETVRFEDKQNMNQNLCIDYCASNEQTFAALQDGYICWCSEVLTQSGKIDDSHCRKTCAGNAIEYCGGPSAMTTFAICEENHYGPKCELICLCYANAVCNFMTGFCPNGGCEDGWYGNRCDTGRGEKSTFRKFLDTLVNFLKKVGKAIKDYFVLTEEPPEKCDPGFYGVWCKSRCHCSTDCDRLTGVCVQPTCARGWLGRRCDKPDPCAALPCENNGVCKMYGFTMHCECTAGYSGINCETEDPCFKGPCLNGGTCVRNGTAFKCQCQGDFSGILCDLDLGKVSITPIYLGCFREAEKEREFTKQMDLPHETMAPMACTKRCRAKLYTYAALQNGDQCWCSNSYAQYGAVAETTCNKPCRGDKKTECGGPYANSVYAVCPVGTYRADCQGLCHCLGAQCDLVSGNCPSPYCQVGYFGDKCDQPRVETAETYKKSRKTIVYGLGAFAGFTVAQVACLAAKASRPSVNEKEGETKDETKETPKKTDIESQKKELDALLGLSMEKTSEEKVETDSKSAARDKTSKSASS